MECPTNTRRPSRKSHLRLPDGRHDVIPEMPRCNIGSAATLPMMPDVEEENRIACFQEGLSQSSHGAVVRPPTMYQNQDRPTVVILRFGPENPPVEDLAIGGNRDGLRQVGKIGNPFAQRLEGWPNHSHSHAVHGENDTSNNQPGSCSPSDWRDHGAGFPCPDPLGSKGLTTRIPSCPSCLRILSARGTRVTSTASPTKGACRS